ncbi:MAG: VTT domain-containing protein [Planctomycetales bacterium]|nr:VTT domain-containing protein [Planctomycetales bacterium]
MSAQILHSAMILCATLLAGAAVGKQHQDSNQEDNCGNGICHFGASEISHTDNHTYREVQQSAMFDFSWLVQHEQLLRERMAHHPVATWCIGLGVYFVVSLVPGTSGKSIICGWLFGFWGALAMVELGLTGAAVISFVIGRSVAGQLSPHRWRSRFAILKNRFKQHGSFYLLLLRLAHAPFTLLNYGAGAIGVPLTAFCWTTALGLLPGTIVFTYAGTRIPSLQILAGKSAWSLIDFPLMMALAATILIPVLLRYLARRWTRRLGYISSAGVRPMLLGPPTNSCVSEDEQCPP